MMLISALSLFQLITFSIRQLGQKLSTKNLWTFEADDMYNYVWS